MYQIYNYRKKRIRTNNIIICHAIDLIKLPIKIDPIVLHGNYKYTYGLWQNYWIREMNKYALPCHYFMELLDKDYVAYIGLPEHKPSYYIEDLVKHGILEYKYKDSILIVIGENFNEETPEQRLLDHLCDKILSKIVKEYNLSWTNIRLIDECLVLGWEENNKLSGLNYNIKPMQYFDKINLKQSFNKYCNF